MSRTHTSMKELAAPEGNSRHQHNQQADKDNSAGSYSGEGDDWRHQDDG